MKKKTKKAAFWWRATKWVVRNLWTGSKWLVVGVVVFLISYSIKVFRVGA